MARTRPRSTVTPGPPARRSPALAVALFAVLAGIAPVAAETGALVEFPTPVDQVLRAIEDPALLALAQEVLDRNPTVSSAAARARAARQQAPQARALPDPVAAVTAYALSPETRVGPQRVTGSLSQRFPWFGKRGLREQAALRLADALDAEVDARRLELVTQTRRIAWEIAFLDAHRRVVEMDRETLIHFEELARSRYSAGGGTQQDVVKIQAEITKDDNRFLEIAQRRAQLVAELNALRDRPASTPVPDLVLPRRPRRSAAELPALRARALAGRPELARADAEIARADRMVDIARKEYKPDVTLGAAYTAVGRRDDLAGMAPPADDGQNVFGISLSLNLPVQRGRLRAGVEEAAEVRVAAVERKRDVMADIDRALGDLVERLRLTAEQVELFERVLVVQAEQSLNSGVAGYAAGSLNSLDLLDAERVLLDVRTATERARADNAIALARLEGAVGGPLDAGTEGAEP